MTQTRFALWGDLIWSQTPARLNILPGYCVVVEDGQVASVEARPPEDGTPVHDCRGKLIIPGMTDLHLHAPQYTYRGTGMDLELLDWLAQNAFPEEARYADPGYARRAYRIFADDLKRHRAR